MPPSGPSSPGSSRGSPVRSPTAGSGAPAQAGLALLYRTAPADALAQGPADPDGGAAGSEAPARAQAVRGAGFEGWRWHLAKGERPKLNPTAAAQGYALAVVPQRVAAAAPKLLVMDVDSTLIRQEVIELLAAHAGREAEVAAVTESAMRGELDFTQSLHHRVRALAGLPEAVVAEVVAAVEPQQGAREVIGAFRAAGWQVCAVSGGFTQVLAPLAEDLGLSRFRANDLEIEDGRLTGRVRGEVVDRTVKAGSLRAWAAEAGVPTEGVIAVGDGANDIDLLDAAGLAVAFCAKPALREHADVELDVPTLEVIRVLAGL